MTSTLLAGTRSFCFNPNDSLDQVYKEIAFIELEKDRLELNRADNCIEALLTHSRLELYSKLISKKYQMVAGSRNRSMGVVEKSKNCQMEFIRETKIFEKGLDISTGKKKRLQKTERLMEGREVSKLLLGSGKTGHLMIDNEQIDLTCRVGYRDNFNIVLGLTGKKTNLETSFTLKRNVKKEIGSVVDELRKKRQNFSLKGISHQKSKSKTLYNYYLIMR